MLLLGCIEHACATHLAEQLDALAVLETALGTAARAAVFCEEKLGRRAAGASVRPRRRRHESPRVSDYENPQTATALSLSHASAACARNVPVGIGNDAQRLGENKRVGARVLERDLERLAGARRDRKRAWRLERWVAR